jgi:hypothetical protein
MIESTRRLVMATCGLALLMPLFATTQARAYPEQVIKIIVTFPPGGSSDILIRAIEPIVAQELKQSIVIENRGGAGGNIGMTAVAQAKPDGYTLGVAPAGALTVNAHLVRNMPFDPNGTRHGRCACRSRAVRGAGHSRLATIDSRGQVEGLGCFDRQARRFPSERSDIGGGRVARFRRGGLVWLGRSRRNPAADS